MKTETATGNERAAPRMVHGLPAWTYRSPEMVDLEHQRLIVPSWQFACHVSEVAEPGQYAVFDLMRDSIVVVRGRDGELRGFQNVCRHRGARLVDEAGICRGLLTCPYHGWSYGLDGSLAGVPSSASFPGLDRADYGLNRVDLEVFHGLVFVRIAGDGPGVAEMWGDIADIVAPYGIEEMVPSDQSWTEVWESNWKVAVDNNLENYHVPIGHPGYHRMLDSDLMGFMNEHGVAGSKSVLRDRPSSNPTERLYQELAPSALAHLGKEARRTWQFFSMPPNIGIDVYPDSMDVFQILPLGPETCTVRTMVYARPGAEREERILQYLNSRINRQVGAEDKELSERVQKGLGAHGYEPGPLSAIEHCIHDFHDRVRAAIPAAALDEEPAPGTLAQVDEALRQAAEESGPLN
jgi:phenylpropionate dioxygenase-like ring-hydroxylating dioxygenase large terminal subunit